MSETIEYSTDVLGHLGLVSGMYDELGIGKLIDDLIPQDLSQRHVSVGQGIKAMVLNGLGFVNYQLYMVETFFLNKPTERLIGSGVFASHLNDDTLGRALDAIYDYGVSELFYSISHEALRHLGLSSSHFYHVDSTTFHVHGNYNSHCDASELGDGVIHITRGYSRDHRADLNQIVLDLIVEQKSAIPILMKPLSGNSSDKVDFIKIIQTHIDNLKNDTQNLKSRCGVSVTVLKLKRL